MSAKRREGELFEEAVMTVVDQGNEYIEAGEEVDPWEIASGMLAGAIQFWLFTRQPCPEPNCADCAEISSPEQRLALLLEEARDHASRSDYYHSPNDREA